MAKAIRANSAINKAMDALRVAAYSGDLDVTKCMQIMLTSEIALDLYENRGKVQSSPTPDAPTKVKGANDPNGGTIGGNKETKKKKAKYNLDALYTKEFMQFWNKYPNRKAKKVAAEAWSRMDPADQGLAMRDVIDLDRPSKDPKWTEDDGRFVPMPATYLNQRRWEDAWQAVGAPTNATAEWIDGQGPEAPQEPPAAPEAPPEVDQGNLF